MRLHSAIAIALSTTVLLGTGTARAAEDLEAPTAAVEASCALDAGPVVEVRLPQPFDLSQVDADGGFWYDLAAGRVLGAAEFEGDGADLKSEPLRCQLAAGSDPETATCVPYFGYCSSQSQCCSGLICRRNSNIGRYQCLNCQGALGYCERTSDCCTSAGLQCRRATSTGKPACRTCAISYAFCDTNSNCCSGSCVNNRCR